MTPATPTAESRDLFVALTGYWPSLPLELQRELVLLALEHRIDTMTRAEADANTRAQAAQHAARRGNLRLVASPTREEA